MLSFILCLSFKLRPIMLNFACGWLIVLQHTRLIHCQVFPPRSCITHWGRVTHICVGNVTIIGPDNGLLPGRRQAIIWTNAGILLIGPWGTNFSEILRSIHTFSFMKIHLKISSAKWRPFCLGLNVIMVSRCRGMLVTRRFRHAAGILVHFPVEPGAAQADFSRDQRSYCLHALICPKYSLWACGGKTSPTAPCW